MRVKVRVYRPNLPLHSVRTAAKLFHIRGGPPGEQFSPDCHGPVHCRSWMKNTKEIVSHRSAAAATRKSSRAQTASGIAAHNRLRLLRSDSLLQRSNGSTKSRATCGGCGASSNTPCEPGRRLKTRTSMHRVSAWPTPRMAAPCRRHQSKRQGASPHRHHVQLIPACLRAHTRPHERQRMGTVGRSVWTRPAKSWPRTHPIFAGPDGVHGSTASVAGQ